jgi:DNA-binding SARP family transcriptional activator
MPVLSVYLLGKFAAHIAHLATPVGLEIRKVQELLGYLLLHRGQPQHRETLAGTLWAETTPAQSRANLRKTLWQLHAALAPSATADATPLLDIQGEWLQIHPQADLWLDVTLFEQAYAASKGQCGEELSAPVAAQLAEAVTLYRSDLLDGWYQDWCLLERERLQEIYLSLLDKLMGYAEAHAKYEQGLAYGTDALRYDQTREQIHRRMMRMHVLAGDRPAALRQYDRCRAILREDLGITPAEQTSALREQIRSNTLDLAPRCDDLSATRREIAEIHALLHNLQRTLSATQEYVRKQLETIELLRNQQ